MSAHFLCSLLTLPQSLYVDNSSTTQAIVLVLLNKWGHDGFIAHTRRVADFYLEKRDMFERVAHKHLDGLATWVSPDAGMFVRLLPSSLAPLPRLS
jgi:DNA-binding transcriptional MocR family regulator